MANDGYCECDRNSLRVKTRPDNQSRARAKPNGSSQAGRTKTPQRSKNGKKVGVETSKRLQEMSLPRVRVLKANRAQFRSVASRKRIKGLGKMMAKSKALMYSKKGKKSAIHREGPEARNDGSTQRIMAEPQYDTEQKSDGYCTCIGESLSETLEVESAHDRTRNDYGTQTQSQHDLGEECSERLKQMALPRVRYLRGTLAVVQPFASQSQIEVIDNRIVQSKTSMYSQMAKTAGFNGNGLARMNRNGYGRNPDASATNNKKINNNNQASSGNKARSKSCHSFNDRNGQDRSQKKSQPEQSQPERSQPGRLQPGKSQPSRSKNGKMVVEKVSERLQAMSLPRVRVLKDNQARYRYSKMAKQLCETPNSVHNMEIEQRPKFTSRKPPRRNTRSNRSAQPQRNAQPQYQARNEQMSECYCSCNDAKMAKNEQKSECDCPCNEDKMAERYCACNVDKMAESFCMCDDSFKQSQPARTDQSTECYFSCDDEKKVENEPKPESDCPYNGNGKICYCNCKDGNRSGMRDKGTAYDETAYDGRTRNSVNFINQTQSHLKETLKPPCFCGEGSEKINHNESGYNQNAAERHNNYEDSSGRKARSRSCHCFDDRNGSERSQQGRSKSGLMLAEECSERLQQMALPRVRVLEDNRILFRSFARQSRIEGINLRMHKSRTSMYSKMAKSVCETPRYEKENRKTVPIRNTRQKSQFNPDRQVELAKPRWMTKIYPHGADPDEIKPPVLTYEITPRMLALTTPNNSPPPPDERCWCYERPYPVPTKYACIESRGINALARPKQKRERYDRSRSNKLSC